MILIAKGQVELTDEENEILNKIELEAITEMIPTEEMKELEQQLEPTLHRKNKTEIVHTIHAEYTIVGTDLKCFMFSIFLFKIFNAYVDFCHYK